MEGFFSNSTFLVLENYNKPRSSMCLSFECPEKEI